METKASFDLGLEGYAAHRLRLEDMGAIAELSEKCLDYLLLMGGQTDDTDTAAKEYPFAPPGKGESDKFLFGIVNRENELVGLLDVQRDYPEKGTWWIATLVFIPALRSHGLGQKVAEGFAGYVRQRGGRAIMLGVVEENARAFGFWTRMGFELLRHTEPRQYGKQWQRVLVLRQTLPVATQYGRSRSSR